MHLKSNYKYIFLLVFASICLFIFPWTKQVKTFRAKDVNWDILKSAVKVKKFNSRTYTFSPIFKLNYKILKLNNKEIRIKGFYKKEKHADETHFILTENLTNVCFACDHDEHYNFIQMFPGNDEIKSFDTLKNDKMIEVTGNFEINRKKSFQSVFLLKNAHLIKIFN